MSGWLPQTKLMMRASAAFRGGPVAACHKDVGGAAAAQRYTSQPKAPVTPKQGPSVAEQTAGMVEAAAQGKSQLPVQLKFELTQRPKVGQALDINLALMPQIDGSPAIIKVTGGDGLHGPCRSASEFDIPEPPRPARSIARP